MDDLYRDYILEHYRRPHNFGIVEDADASYEGANPLCGDRITLMLGVKDGVVDRVGFTGRGHRFDRGLERVEGDVAQVRDEDGAERDPGRQRSHRRDQVGDEALTHRLTFRGPVVDDLTRRVGHASGSPTNRAGRGAQDESDYSPKPPEWQR